MNMRDAPAEKPLISIVVSLLNEEADIRQTAEALAKLRYLNKEVIFVDGGSTDRTPLILQEYVAANGFRLIQQRDRGVAEGRNRGILASRGEIVVILNADVHPSEDFLDRILPHYERGADFVLVQDRVANQEDLFPRYLQAQGLLLYHWQEWMNWTEGFSCRKSAALSVGLFPEIPGAGGEDAVFGERLAARRFKKVVDPSIVVLHTAPSTLQAYWAGRATRGRGIPFRNFLVYNVPRPFLLARACLATCYAVARLLTVLPIVVTCARIARYSPKGIRDLAPFCYAAAIEIIASRVGEWKGCLSLYRRRRLET